LTFPQSSVGAATSFACAPICSRKRPPQDRGSFPRKSDPKVLWLPSNQFLQHLRLCRLQVRSEKLLSVGATTDHAPRLGVERPRLPDATAAIRDVRLTSTPRKSGHPAAARRELAKSTATVVKQGKPNFFCAFRGASPTWWFASRTTSNSCHGAVSLSCPSINGKGCS
jgi:hypothetical protein